jgi:hypothetical protein
VRGLSREDRPGQLTRSAAVFLEVFFYFEGGHAAAACGGDGLAVAAVLDVSAGEDAGDDFAVEGWEDVVLSEDVAVGVEVHHALEGESIGDVADAEEHEADGKDVLFVGDQALEAEAFDVFFLHAKHLFNGSAGEEFNLRVSHGAVEHDLRGAKFFSAINDGDFGREASEEESLFHGRVAAADDGDLFSGGEESVTGGTGADAVADESLLGGEIEPARGSTRGDDESAGVDGLMAQVEREGAFGEIDGAEVSHPELGAEADCLLLHVLDELRALDTLGPAGEVFDQRGDGELAAGLVAFEDERLEVGACGVNGSGKSGAAGAEDDSVARRVFRHMTLLV